MMLTDLPRNIPRGNKSERRIVDFWNQSWNIDFIIFFTLTRRASDDIKLSQFLKYSTFKIHPIEQCKI